MQWVVANLLTTWFDKTVDKKQSDTITLTNFTICCEYISEYLWIALLIPLSKVRQASLDPLIKGTLLIVSSNWVEGRNQSQV